MSVISDPAKPIETVDPSRQRTHRGKDHRDSRPIETVDPSRQRTHRGSGPIEAWTHRDRGPIEQWTHRGRGPIEAEDPSRQWTHRGRGPIETVDHRGRDPSRQWTHRDSGPIETVPIEAVGYCPSGPSGLSRVLKVFRFHMNHRTGSSVRFSVDLESMEESDLVSHVSCKNRPETVLTCVQPNCLIIVCLFVFVVCLFVVFSGRAPPPGAGVHRRLRPAGGALRFDAGAAIRSARQRRSDITAQEMSAVMDERDRNRVRVKRLEEQIQDLQFSKAELVTLQRERDLAVGERRRLEAELQELRANRRSPAPADDVTAPPPADDVTAPPPADDVTASSLPDDVTALQQRLAMMSQQKKSAEAELVQTNEKVRRLERLVEVLRKKVGTGSVRAIV
ncbi:hypothetical protein WMY93_033295 [Mugilogobius chulae]|uniref:Uncharacterized protein n=1 Tax=Mugilogobius chulae TaxID=88201 RepID=A0AAW0MNA2_9GOBI